MELTGHCWSVEQTALSWHQPHPSPGVSPTHEPHRRPPLSVHITETEDSISGLLGLRRRSSFFFLLSITGAGSCSLAVNWISSLFYGDWDDGSRQGYRSSHRPSSSSSFPLPPPLSFLKIHFAICPRPQFVAVVSLPPSSLIPENIKLENRGIWDSTSATTT